MVSVWQSSLQTSQLARLTLQTIKAILDLIVFGSLSWISKVNPRSSKEKDSQSRGEEAKIRLICSAVGSQEAGPHSYISMKLNAYNSQMHAGSTFEL